VEVIEEITMKQIKDFPSCSLKTRPEETKQSIKGRKKPPQKDTLI
jgi:hypothetical protein